MDWQQIAAQVAACGAGRLDDATVRRVGGGDINDAWVVDTSECRLFVKTNRADRHDMFVAEATGLDEIAASNTVRVPAVVCHGIAGAHAYLVLEWLQFERPDTAAARQLGTTLAAMHSVTAPEYGWHRDNTIGSTPQINTCSDDWAQFFARHRIGFQLQLARDKGAQDLYARGMRLCAALPALLNAPVKAGLLHGDLWGGNWGVADGNACIFDPAVYYGDPETDIAMTELFGGFGPDFYAAYREVLPERDGDATRRGVYRLYHVLNHFNLFGGGYRGQAMQLIEGLL